MSLQTEWEYQTEARHYREIDQEEAETEFVEAVFELLQKAQDELKDGDKDAALSLLKDAVIALERATSECAKCQEHRSKCYKCPVSGGDYGNQG